VRFSFTVPALTGYAPDSNSNSGGPAAAPPAQDSPAPRSSRHQHLRRDLIAERSTHPTGPASRRGPRRAGALVAWLFAPAAGDSAAVVASAPVVPVRTLVRRFWPFARPLRRVLALGVLVLLLVPAVEAAQVWLFKVLVDEALVPASFGPLGWIALAYLGLFLLGALFSFSDEYLSAWAGEHFVLRVRRHLYTHLLRQSPDVLDRRRLGDVLARVSSDVQTIENFLLGGVGEAISAVFRIALFAGLLFYLQWDLALVALVVAPFFWISARAFSRLIKEASREKRRRAGSLGAVAEEGLANAVLVQTSNRQAAELERFERESRGILQAELAATRLRALFGPLVELIELAGVLLVLGWGTWALSQDQLTLGGLLAFLAYLGLLYRPVRDLGHVATSMFEASAAAERVLELLDREPLVEERAGARRLERAQGQLQLENVVFRYPDAHRSALDGLSLTIASGETILVSGASGAGKSTLARLLVRLYDPDEGTVRLDGIDLRDLALESVRTNVAVLLQEQLLFDATVGENLVYARPDATEEQVEAAARAAKVEQPVDLPIGQRGRALSGGQRQRLAIARSLVRDAPVLVLDEPFAGLDEAAARGLLPALVTASRGRTTILISHHPLARSLATRAFELDDGRLREVTRPIVLEHAS
jgi:ATP-binding cassette, subfamily B, bacterial